MKFKDLYDFWFKIDDKIRYLVIGSCNAAISYIIFALALFIIGEEYYQICVALQWVISSVFSYFNQKIFVFRTKGNYFKEYIKCCSSWFVGYLLNVLIIEVLVKFMNTYAAQFIAIGLVSVITYILFKYFAFKPHK